MTKLALFGGAPVISGSFVEDTTLGDDDFAAVQRVFERGSLSAFYGSWGEEFLGGVEVKDLEAQWAAKFNVKHAVSVNSATSGLYAAMAALGISPGDEVIVPPMTMSATVMAPLVYGGIPVFADVDPDTFCLDVNAVAEAITDRTRAVIAVNLFGHPAPLMELKKLCEAKGIALVEDNAQGPLAMEGGRYAGTIGDIGVYSLNYHKHIHAGEGGICVTSNENLKVRLQAVRNHAENVVEQAEIEPITNMVGFNYRMTEMSAAVAISQLQKIDFHVERRRSLALKLSEGVSDLPGIQAPKIRDDCHHVFYLWSIKLDEAVLGVSRERFSEALQAEGFPHLLGYVKPLYNLPLFKRRTAIGRDGWPFSLTDRTYEQGLCPVAEKLYAEELLGYEVCMYKVDDIQVGQLVEAIRKVHNNIPQLRIGI